MDRAVRVLLQPAVAVAFMAMASVPRAHEHSTDPVAADKLGSVSFQASCDPDVGADINRGIALLHSFWHEEARRTFDKAAAADPECAIAYWGQAMASFHLFASTPSDKELADGRAALARGSKATKRSPREIAWLKAAGALYEGYKPADHLVFAQRFANAMGALARKYPDDLEAKTFYGLALLAADPPADTTLANARKAVSLLQPLLAQHPDHPGIAHYMIHACDNPQMSGIGVEAARQYAQIAPAAPHALHMPSHIFARRGLWTDDIRSNLASKAVAESTPHVGAENRLHAMEFLQYAYLQTGQHEEAHAVMAEAQAVNSADVNYPEYYLTVEAKFPVLLAIETQDWMMAANLKPIPNAHWFSHAHTLLANAVSAGHRRDAEAGAKARETFDSFADKVRAIPPGTSAAHLRDEIYAWSAFSHGNVKEALDLLRPIADRQALVGKGEVELPAREMLAQMLMLDGKPREALTEYERSLETDPNRFNGLLGAARAAEQLGEIVLAGDYYRQLLANCPSANGTAAAVLEHARAVAGM